MLVVLNAATTRVSRRSYCWSSEFDCRRASVRRRAEPRLLAEQKHGLVGESRATVHGTARSLLAIFGPAFRAVPKVNHTRSNHCIPAHLDSQLATAEHSLGQAIGKSAVGAYAEYSRPADGFRADDHDDAIVTEQQVKLRPYEKSRTGSEVDPIVGLANRRRLAIDPVLNSPSGQMILTLPTC